ncbi:hypothetical protein SPFM6_00191 [Salmonella phage SPFM6]|nr:hypothetical protein SPFM6_00191 [Salmonella phage SPFM6]
MNNCPIRVRETGLRLNYEIVYRSINGKCRHSLIKNEREKAVTIETLMRVADTDVTQKDIALLVGCSPSQISALAKKAFLVRLSYIITRVTANSNRLLI